MTLATILTTGLLMSIGAILIGCLDVFFNKAKYSLIIANKLF
jgi:hypothetical protein